MKARILSALVTMAVIAAGVGVYLYTRPSTETYTLTADIDQAPNLFAGGRVMVRGVDVGRIISIEPLPDGVRLTLEVDASIKVPADATLSVIPVTVISDRYVQLFPEYDGGPVMADGDHIPMDRTSIPAELDDVLTQLQGLLEALEPKEGHEKGSLARLIDSLDKVFANKADELTGALEGSATVLENLADSERNLTGLIQGLDRLFLSVANRSSEIGIVNERFQLVAEALLADQDHLEGTIENIAFLSDEAADLLNSSGRDLGSSFERLGRVLRVILKHQGSLKRGIQWSNVIAQTLGETDASGKGIYAYTGRRVPPGTAGAGENYRLDSRDILTCERLQQVANSVIVVLPQANIDDIVDTALSYIPDYYDEDLEFLIRILVEECVEFPNSPSIDEETTATLQEVADRVGTDEFIRFLGRWLVQGSQAVAP